MKIRFYKCNLLQKHCRFSILYVGYLKVSIKLCESLKKQKTTSLINKKPHTAQGHVRHLGMIPLNHFSSLCHLLLGIPFVLINTLAYTNILQLQHSGGVVRLDVFWQEYDQETRVSEGHFPLLSCGPVLGTFFLSEKEKKETKMKRDLKWVKHPTKKHTW